MKTDLPEPCWDRWSRSLGTACRRPVRHSWRRLSREWNTQTLWHDVAKATHGNRFKLTKLVFSNNTVGVVHEWTDTISSWLPILNDLRSTPTAFNGFFWLSAEHSEVRFILFDYPSVCTNTPWLKNVPRLACYNFDIRILIFFLAEMLPIKSAMKRRFIVPPQITCASVALPGKTGKHENCIFHWLVGWLIGWLVDWLVGV